MRPWVFMSTSLRYSSGPVHCFQTFRQVLVDCCRFLLLNLRCRSSLAAEDLFLRKQLALFQEREVKLRRNTDSTRLLMVFLGKFLDWRSALVIVKSDTLVCWHRNGFRLFWRWKSKPRGRPKLPTELRELICAMAADNPTWGEARIADELLLKLGILLTPA